MKKTLSIIIVLLLAFHCYGQEKEQTKKAITYNVGIAYNQIWLPSFFYGPDEFGTSSSPFNWGVSPFFSMQKNRWTFNFGCSYMSLLRNYRYSKTRYYVDKWQEASLASTVGFRVTGERQRINITPFLGVDLSYLINYEKDVTWGGTSTTHYNTDQLGARFSDYNVTWMPFGLGILGGIVVSYPITKHFEIGLSYCMKFKVKNDIRGDLNPHFPYYVTSPVFYHNASIGVAYRFN